MQEIHEIIPPHLREDIFHYFINQNGSSQTLKSPTTILRKQGPNGSACNHLWLKLSDAEKKEAITFAQKYKLLRSSLLRHMANNIASAYSDNDEENFNELADEIRKIRHESNSRPVEETLRAVLWILVQYLKQNSSFKTCISTVLNDLISQPFDFDIDFADREKDGQFYHDMVLNIIEKQELSCGKSQIAMSWKGMNESFINEEEENFRLIRNNKILEVSERDKKQNEILEARKLLDTKDYLERLFAPKLEELNNVQEKDALTQRKLEILTNIDDEIKIATSITALLEILAETPDELYKSRKREGYLTSSITSFFGARTGESGLLVDEARAMLVDLEKPLSIGNPENFVHVFGFSKSN